MFVRKYKGFTGHYAKTELSKEEFFKGVNKKLYYNLREKYNAKNHFPNIYDKMK